MAGTMSSLYVGVSGLQVSQHALNTTAHNLANVDTKGYVRQQVLIADSNYENISRNHISTDQVGLGANIIAVRQVRDAFLDKAYREELGRQGFYEAGFQAVDEVESIFGELEGVAFQNSMEDFWSSVHELAKEPDNIVNRTTLVQTAVSFVERATLISKQLNDYQLNLNEAITGDVKKVNEIGKQISELNQKINQVESAGMERANDYRDTRNSLLDELGKLVNITYKEIQNGSVDVSIEGVQFIVGNDVHQMALKTVSDENKMVVPIWPHIGKEVFDTSIICSTSSDTDIGSLKGLVMARGNKKADYTDIPVRPVEPKKESYDKIEEYNKAYKQYQEDMKQYEKQVDEYNKDTNQSVIQTAQSQFDQLIHGIVTAVNDILCPNKTVTILNDQGKQQQISVLDTEHAPVGMGEGNQIQGTELFTRNTVSRYEEKEVIVVHEDGSQETMKLKVYNEEQKEDPYSLYTLGEIKVNEDVLKNVSLIPLNHSSNDAAYDIGVCDTLVKVWGQDFTTLGPNTLTVSTFKDYYTNFIGELANRGNTYHTIAETQQDTANAVDKQRQQIAGVSSDEELSNMIKYQHAYNASSRYISVVSDMLEHLLTSLG